MDDRKKANLILKQLRQELNPVGTLENFLVERAAMIMMRLSRFGRIEADWLTPDHLSDTIGYDSMEMVSEKFSRYEAALDNRFIRCIHELERLQRKRLGENIPPPAAVDVNITDLASFGN